MAKRSKPLDQITAEAEQILRVWDANPTFTLGEVTLVSFKADLEDFKQTRAHNEELRRQVTQSVNTIDDKAVKVTRITTRALSGIRAVFGPDSSQYEEAGGTRTSDRKKTNKGGGNKTS